MIVATNALGETGALTMTIGRKIIKGRDCGFGYAERVI